MRLFSLVPTKTEDGTSLIKIIIPVVLVFVVSIVVIVLYCRYVEISYPDIMSTRDLGTSQDWVRGDSTGDKTEWRSLHTQSLILPNLAWNFVIWSNM